MYTLSTFLIGKRWNINVANIRNRALKLERGKGNGCEGGNLIIISVQKYFISKCSFQNLKKWCRNI